MNNFILELPELKNYYPQAELMNLWDNNLHIPLGDSPEIQNDPNYCLESKIIKLDIAKKFNRAIMTKEPEIWLMHKFAEHEFLVHVDPCLGLIIPISPQVYELQFIKPHYVHKYRMPAIVNGTIPHHVKDKGIERTWLLIYLFLIQQSDDPWQDVNNYYNNGLLIK